MSIEPHAAPVTLDRLTTDDLVEVFGYLDRDPVLNVYLIALAVRDALAVPRDEFWGARRDARLVGVLHLGAQSGAVLPLGDDPAALRLLADHAVARRPFLPGRFQVIGPRDAARATTSAFRAAGVEPRIVRDQIYMALERDALPGLPRVPQLRPARPHDYELVHESGSLLRAEELEEDPREVDAAGYGRRVEEECRDGYTYLWIDADGLCFRASVSAMTPDAAQVSGVYVPAGRRGLGFATRGLGELCARLFERSRALCLFVNDFNAPAIAAYRRLGFTPRAPWASAFFAAPR